LRDPWLAAFLAWLWPGLGHIYQRRWGKGGLYMTCILATFIYGLWLGQGKVVYASFRDPDFREWRWAYVAQVGTGLPALPAIVQSLRMSGPTPKAPLWGGLMAPPLAAGQLVPQAYIDAQRTAHPDDPEYDEKDFRDYDKGGIYYCYVPAGARDGDRFDQSNVWNYWLGWRYDLGTVFTMIAGLLNILAIWDAWGGPVIMQPAPATK
jgi:hypothetical protein